MSDKLYKEFNKMYAKSDKETITEHTENLLKGYDTLMSLYGSFFSDDEKKLIRLACEYHDLGKCNKLFQNMIQGKKSINQIPHGLLSGMFFDIEKLSEEFQKMDIKALITAVHYHHNRQDPYTDEEYEEYITENILEYNKDFYNNLLDKGFDDDDVTYYLTKRMFINSDSASSKRIDDLLYQKYMIIKGILNKLDYAASAHDETLEIPCDPEFTNRIHNRFDTLRPAQQFMYENSDSNIIVTAPTGSGKTEGALLWAGCNKTFYTLPMKVSANDIFMRIKNTYDYKNAGLLHSDSAYIYNSSAENGDGAGLDEYRQVKRLEKPLTVCTVDQIFKFVFNAVGTEIFGATLKYSRVIIDELQMYNSKITAMLIHGLNTISAMGGKYAIITATLPSFIKNMLNDENTESADFTEDDKSERHIVSYNKRDFDYEKIMEDAKTKKVLVICNTVKKAQEVFEKLPGARVLHGRFIQQHKKILERAIIDFARGAGTGIWISTQIVEASLDIDFDVLYTEMCSADSLLQRMGRCFRARTYNESEPNIYIYDNGNEYKIYDNDIFARSVDFINKYCGRIFTEAEKQRYIDDVFKEDEIRETKYYRDIEDTLEMLKNTTVNLYSKKDADELFRNIQSTNVIPDSIYQEHIDEVEEWINCIANKKNSLAKRLEAEQKLNELTVSINTYGGDIKFKDRKITENYGKGKDIYVTIAKYEFDEEALTGRGLLRSEDS